MSIQSSYPEIVADTITGYAPLTVHLNNLFDSTYQKWDFGDTGRTNTSGFPDEAFDADNDLYKTKCPEMVMGGGSVLFTQGNSTPLKRDIDLNTDQRGIAAAYTYYKPGTYTVTLQRFSTAGSTPIEDTITVVVEDPAPATYPARNPTTDWTEIRIDTEGDTGGTDFATAIANANAGGGKAVIIVGGSVDNLKLSAGVTIDCSDLVIRSEGTITPELTFSLDGGSVRDGVDLITISSTSQNIYIEAIDFTSHDDEGRSSSDPLHMNSYDPSSHTSIRGIVAQDDIGTTARAICLQRCTFWNFTRGVDIDTGSGLFVSNCTTNRHNEAHIHAAMDNVVISSSVCATNTQFAPTQTMNNDFLSGDPSFIYEIGSSSRSGNHCSVQFCNLDYNGVANYETFSSSYPAASTYIPSGSIQVQDSGSFSGPVLIQSMTGCSIYRNVLKEGTNSLNEASSGAVFANYFSTGGMSAALEINTSTNGITIFSNAIELFAGRAQSYAIASRSTPTIGSDPIEGVDIANNTFLFSKDISKNGAAIYLVFPDLASQDAVSFVNNIVVDHHLYQAKVIQIGNSSQVGPIQNNVYFSDRPNVPFALVNGSSRTYLLWNALHEPTASIERILWSDMKRYWGMCPDPNKHSALNDIEFSDSRVFVDLTGYEYTGTSDIGVGCTKIQQSAFNIGSTNSFNIQATVSSRADRSISGVLDKDGNPFFANPGDNLRITITDPDNGYVIMDDFAGLLLETSGTEFERVGLYIRTDITDIEIEDDTLEFTLTYTNDGPAGQVYYTQDGYKNGYDSLTPEEQSLWADHEYFFNYADNDVVNCSLGQMYILQAKLGRLFSVYQGYRGSQFGDVEKYAGNIFNLSNRTYPGSKYCPCEIISNRDYAIAVSVMWNIETESKYRFIFENMSATGSSKGTVSARFSWRRGWTIQNPQTKTTGKTTYTPIFLEEGETFSVRYSYKISRNSRYERIELLEAYKDYFQSTYGGLQYTVDPRPIRGYAPIQDFTLSFPSNVYGYARASERPDLYGWEGSRNRILNHELLYGHERTVMWAPAGMYIANRSANFPFLMWTPFFDPNQRSVGEFTPTTAIPDDVQAASDADIAAGGDGLIDFDYPNGTFNPYPVQATFDTINLMQDLNFIYPNMGYYWGRATQVNFIWDAPAGNRRYYEVTDPVGVEGYYKEFDAMAKDFKARFVGMDAYHGSRYGLLDDSPIISSFRRRYQGPIDQEIALMREMIQRWPHAKLLTELALNDVYHLLGAMYYFNTSTNNSLREKNSMADYLCPGQESWSGFRFDLFVRHWGNRHDQTDDQRRYMMREMARLGIVPLTTNDVDLRSDVGTGYSAEDFYITDGREEFETLPSDGQIPAQPSRFSYLVNDSQPLFDENYIRLRWDANSENDIRFYRIQKARMVNGAPDPNDFMTIDYTTNNWYFDIVNRDGEQYIYRLTAIDFDGNESIESEYTVTKVSNAPTLLPPVPIRAQPNTSNGSIRIDWQEPS